MFDVMGPVSWIFIGLLAGALAKFFMPGKDPGGCLVTILIGIAGAFVGGLIASYVGFGGVSGPNLPTLLTATGGAFVLLFVLRLFRGSR